MCQIPVYESHYAGEKDLVSQFIKYSASNPIHVGNKDLPILIWGYEIWVMEGGRYGHSGRIDLLGTDIEGNVWLIEAKEGENPELRSDIWESQVLPYRTGLMQTSPEMIILRSERYLTGHSVDMLPPSFISENCDNLLDIFICWLKHLDYAGSIDKANELYSSTFGQLMSGEIILVVLSDWFCPSIWESRPKDYPTAYNTCSGVDNQFTTNIYLDGHTNLTVVPPISPEYSKEAWNELRAKKRREKLTPEVLRDIISNDVADLYEQLINELQLMGWDGTPWTKSTCSFGIRFMTEHGVYVYIDVGKPDKDSRDLDRAAKLKGTAGFKCDVTFTDSKNDIKFREVALRTMRRLETEAGYQVKGKRKPFVERPKNQDGIEKFSFQLTHRRDGNKRDYIGRRDDKADLVSMLDIVKKLIVK